MASPSAIFAADTKRLASSQEDFEKNFSLGPSERLVEDYSCSLIKLVPVRGRLYISQNWLCFSPLIGGVSKWSFSDLKSAEKTSVLLVPTAIAVTTSSNEKFTLSGFVHRDSALQIIQHLIRFRKAGPLDRLRSKSIMPRRVNAPVDPASLLPASMAASYSSASSRNSARPISSSMSSSPASTGFSSSPSQSSKPSAAAVKSRSAFDEAGDDEPEDDSYDARRNALLGGGGSGANRQSQSQQVDYMAMDSSSMSGDQIQAMTKEATQNTKQSLQRSLQMAEESRAMGAATLVKLHDQGEQIKRIGRHVEEIDANLNESDRTLRSMETIGGALKNAMFSQPDASGRQMSSYSEEGMAASMLRIDPSMELSLPTFSFSMDMEILRQKKEMSNGSAYYAQVLRFGGVDKLLRVRVDSNKSNTETVRNTYPYTAYDKIIIRAKPYHITFVSNDPAVKHLHFMTIRIEDVIQLMHNRQMAKSADQSNPKYAAIEYEDGCELWNAPRITSYSSTPAASSSAAGAGSASRQARAQLLDSGSSSSASSPSSGGAASASAKPALDPEDEAMERMRAELAQNDDALDRLSHLLGDMSHISRTTQYTIKDQNAVLDSIVDKVDHVDSRIKAQSKRIDKFS